MGSRVTGLMAIFCSGVAVDISHNAGRTPSSPSQNRERFSGAAMVPVALTRLMMIGWLFSMA